MADELREDLALDRDRAAGGIRSITEGSITYAPALTSSVSISPGSGFSRKPSTSPSSAAAHEPVGARVVDRVEAERDHGAGLLVLLLERGQVEVGEQVAVEDHEAVAEQALVGGEADGPGVPSGSSSSM